MEVKIDGKLQPKFRIIMLGCKSVGKTSLINQYINNNFRSDYYPTKDIIIYKTLHNFCPDIEEIDDYCYIEILDTMAFDRSKNLKDFSEFFTVHLVSERDISRTNVNSKIPDSIIKCIKHEYVSGNTSTKGLFSNDKIMAYIFVYDYSDDRSLDEMLDLCYSINTDESIKNTEESFKTIKVFICNKYPLVIDEYANHSLNKDIVSQLINRDQKTREMVNKITRRIMKEFYKGVITKPEDAYNLLFFTSTKQNIGVKRTFRAIFNLIKQKDELWKKITFEEKKEEKKDEDEEENNDDGGFGLFCCKSKKVIDKQNLENKSQNNESVNNEKLKFKDDEDEPGYDENLVIKPPNEEEENKGGCIII